MSNILILNPVYFISQQQNRRLGKKKSPKEKELRDKVEELIHTQALLDQSKKALMLKNQEVEELKAKVALFTPHYSPIMSM